MFKNYLVILGLFFAFSLTATVVFAQDTTAPALPHGFDTSGGATAYELLLTWTNPADSDLDHINVYFSPTGAFSSTGIWASVPATPNTKGTATITGLSSGTNYWTYMTSVDAEDNESAYTAELKRTTATSKDSTSPEPVTDFLVTDLTTGGALKLNWTTSVDEDYFQARIHRSLTSEFTPDDTNEIAVVFGTASAAAEYTDSDLTDEVTYYYKIRTEDNRDNIQSGLFYPSASGTPTLVVVEPDPEPDPIPDPETPVVLEDIDGVVLVDGDLITTTDSFDIYIVKIIGGKKFKRLILNPAIFESYAHLKWEDVKTVSGEVQDEFTLSDLVIEVNEDGSVADPKVYKVSSSANSDVGQRQWLNMGAVEFETAGHDWDAIYKINHTEASVEFYPLGSAIVAS